MPRLHYATHIANSPRVVWETMLQHPTYEQWTSAFAKGSTYEGAWEPGARIRFLAPDGSGVVSEIAESRPHEFVSVRHLGMLEHGVEDFESEAVRAWAPAYENYTFRSSGGGTELAIDVDTTPELVEMMNAAWEQGLARLKAMCEARTSFEGATPILPVRQLEASIDFYVNVLAFKVDFVGPGRFAAVSRDRCHLFLSEGDQGNVGTWTWIGVSDVEAVLEECRANGHATRHPPTNYSWAYEMQVEDLDGNVLRIGSEPRADLPSGASWRDMHGDRWERLPSGEWSRVEH